MVLFLGVTIFLASTYVTLNSTTKGPDEKIGEIAEQIAEKAGEKAADEAILPPVGDLDDQNKAGLSASVCITCNRSNYLQF